VCACVCDSSGSIVNNARQATLSSKRFVFWWEMFIIAVWHSRFVESDDMFRLLILTSIVHVLCMEDLNYKLLQVMSETCFWSENLPRLTPCVFQFYFINIGFALFWHEICPSLI
jgi:hypothetical protein